MRKGFAAILAFATLAGCGTVDLSATDAWVRLPAVQGRPGAAYFTIKGGGQDTALLAVSTTAAIRTELHEMKDEGGMMTMKPLQDIAIPAGQTVKFAPGGKHVMLFDVAPSVQAGTTVPIRLSFADGKTVEVQAAVKAAGDAS